MRKQQLENLQVGNKVQEFGKGEIFTVVKVSGREEGKVIIKGENKERQLSKSSLLKNFKLIEETEEVAVTVEQQEIPDVVGYLSQGMVEEQPQTIELTAKEKEFLYHMTDNYFSNILESGGEFTFAVIEQLSYSEKAARGVISSLIKKGMIVVIEHSDDHPVVSFTDQGHTYTEQNLEELKRVTELRNKTKEIVDNTPSEVIPTAIEVVKDNTDNLISSSDLAKELGLTPQDLRRQLRKNQITKPESGWKWTKGSEELQEVVSILKGIQEKRAEKRRG